MAVAAAQAYEKIWERITSGHYRSGERLKEAELVTLCEVSRTPVREALRRLEKDGLVEITPNSGAIVIEWSTQELIDLYTVRASLEGLGARLAAERRDDADISKLEAGAKQMLNLAQAPLTTTVRSDIARLNSQFHHDLVIAAKSRAVSAAAKQVIEAPIMLRTFSSYQPTQLQRSLSDHIEIINAVCEQNAPLAEALMRAHILAGLNALTANQTDSLQPTTED